MFIFDSFKLFIQNMDILLLVDGQTADKKPGRKSLEG